MNKKATVEKRFWDKVNKKGRNECWEWTGCKNSDGYGNIKIDGKSHSAHRISWALTFGEIPNLKDVDYRGTCVLHKCDNRGCVNPNHLFLGSANDNMQDMARKGRGNTCLQHGEHNPQSKLIESQVLKIRKLYSSGEYRLIDIAKLFNISFQHVSDIVNKKRWRYL